MPSTWPASSSGIGLRGGSFNESFTGHDHTISGRGFATYSGYPRQFNIGGRGVRSAPQ